MPTSLSPERRARRGAFLNSILTSSMVVNLCFFLLYLPGLYAIPTMTAILSTCGITAFILTNRLGVLNLSKETANAFADTKQAADALNNLYLLKQSHHSSEELKTGADRSSSAAAKAIPVPSEIGDSLKGLFPDTELKDMSLTNLESHFAERSRLITDQVIKSENWNAMIAVFLIILSGGTGITATFFSGRKEDPTTKTWILMGSMLFALAFFISSRRSAYSIHVLKAEHDRAVTIRRALATHQHFMIGEMRKKLGTSSSSTERRPPPRAELGGGAMLPPGSSHPSPRATFVAAPPAAASSSPSAAATPRAIFLGVAAQGSTVVNAAEGSTVHVVINVTGSTGASGESPTAGPRHSKSS